MQAESLTSQSLGSKGVLTHNPVATLLCAREPVGGPGQRPQLVQYDVQVAVVIDVKDSDTL